MREAIMHNIQASGQLFGVGTDIIEIERIRKAVSDSFLKKCFTEDEREYFRTRNMRTETIAGNFAAKEAIVKALGTGIGRVGWKDVSVLRNESGQPHVVFSENITEWLEGIGAGRVHVSISHCRSLAIAYCAIERK